MAGWHHWLNGRESEWTPGVGDGQGGLACCDSWGHRVGHDWVTELDWTEHGSAAISLRYCSHFLWMYTQKWDYWIKVVLFLIFEKHPHCFPQQLYQFTFPPTVRKNSPFYTSLSALVMSCLFDESHSNRCEVASHCGFDLHFPDD